MQSWQVLPLRPQAKSLVPSLQKSFAQQPSQLVVASHRQVELCAVKPRQPCPRPHSGDEPQRHSPVTHCDARLESQAVHAPPPTPQAASVLPLWQTEPSQHPLGHDIASHTHMLPLHRWPVEHAAPEPQPHEPSARHTLLLVVLQFMHVPPSTPQLPDVGGATHAPPMQHPEGHETWSHTQLLPRHRWPAAHCAEPPQRQLPPMHESERVASHAKHAAPLVPHWPTLGVVHVGPLQQPLEHVVELQPWHA